VQVEANQLPEFSWQTFALVEKAATPVESAPIVSEGGRKLANAHLEAVITENGSLTITDKATQKTYRNLLVFEDVGDIANEYIFKQPEGDQAILSTQFPHHVTIEQNDPLVGIVRLTQELQIPVSADDRLLEEQKAVVDFCFR
ncbi:alpha-mannosidase, partial [Enterococcus faecalis]|nr:alpha-mannosidase [Enterococcus faecalis]